MGVLSANRLRAIALFTTVLIVGACSSDSDSGPESELRQAPTPTPTRPAATPTPGFRVNAPDGPTTPASSADAPKQQQTPIFVEATHTSFGPSHDCLIDEAIAPALPTAMPISNSDATQITIDGDPSDWADRPTVATDPMGDSSEFFDMQSISMFVNHDALYVLVEGDPGAGASSIELDFMVDGRRIRYGWEPNPDWSQPWRADITNEWVDLGSARLSGYALGEVFEARIDLRDLTEGPFEFIFVQMFRGECCGEGYRVVDKWEGSVSPPLVDEPDPAWLTARPGSADYALLSLGHPDTRAIRVDFNPETSAAEVIAGPGAVPPLAKVIVIGLERNDHVVLTADQDGAFATSIAASPGTHVLIKQDNAGVFLRDQNEGIEEDLLAPGVLIPMPLAPASEGFTFAGGGHLCCGDEQTATWGVEGVLDKVAAEPGARVSVTGRVIVHAGPAVKPPSVGLAFKAQLLMDATGRQVGRAGKFITPFLTATGLPIERELEGEAEGLVNLSRLDVSFSYKEGRWVGEFETSLELDSKMREGIYSILVDNLWDIGDTILEPTDTLPFDLVLRDRPSGRANLAQLTVGSPATPRLATLLLADEVSEGARGGYVAREDEGLFDIASRAATRHDPVLPRLDPFGDLWVYQLEPFAPMIDVVDRALPNPPAIDLDLTRSTLTVAVTRPDGRTDILGPSPMTRYGVKSPRTLWNNSMGGGGGELRDVPQLLGDPGTFAYSFPADGDYVVTLSGQMADTRGRYYAICGTYDVTIGRVLDIEMGFLPTTPFEVGDTLAPVVTTIPGVPADIVYSIAHVGPDGAKTIQTFEGQAGTNGYWDGGGQSLTFTNHGEYRVDVQARYTDDSGRIWTGRMRSGSVIATPSAPLVAHGRRGPDGQREMSPPWAFESAFTMQESDHMQFPYFTGDILWGKEHTDAGDAVATHASVQILNPDDPLLARAARQTRDVMYEWHEPPEDEVFRAQQIPLTLGTEPVIDRVKGAHPDDIDLWAYMYSSAQRPGVRVRETIQGSDVDGAYWRFGDAYHGQSGNGPEGDLPDDYKYFYIAAVVRDDNLYDGYYAAYGSAWVHTRDDDALGARFFPPFQGAAGGPDGGPLFNVHGRDIDLFFLPMAVRPGSLLQTGDIFRMSGPVMPTLPSLVEYTVIAPDGTTRSLGGRANAVGYFYNPTDDFTLDQPGVWTVDLSVTHDGITSAGTVQAPFPTGGVLSPDGHTYTFTVLDTNDQTLELTTTLADISYDEWFERVESAEYTAALPDGFSVDEANVTVNMPGNVLVSAPARVRGGELTWTMIPEELGRIADNFDNEWYIADTITVTFSASGTMNGQPSFAAGTTVTHGVRLPEMPVRIG